jgi:hypothetical protein
MSDESIIGAGWAKGSGDIRAYLAAVHKVAKAQTDIRLHPQTFYVGPATYQRAIDEGYITPDGTPTAKWCAEFGDYVEKMLDATAPVPNPERDAAVSSIAQSLRDSLAGPVRDFAVSGAIDAIVPDWDVQYDDIAEAMLAGAVEGAVAALLKFGESNGDEGKADVPVDGDDDAG